MSSNFTYSILNDTLNGTVNLSKLREDIENSTIIISIASIYTKASNLHINFSANISSTDVLVLNNIVSLHDGSDVSQVKIYELVDESWLDVNFKDIDYTILPLNTLFPKRTFSQGELQKVEWFADEALTDLVLQADMVYTRDPYGFATERTTVRTWYQTDGTPHPDTKITTKKYTINIMEQIKEGKRRRGNIVDGIQLPTLSFMVETMTVAPWSLSPGAILLMGRDFMDRHESEFSKFIDNSSSVTDFQDPNFGRKTVVVAIENAANTTDTWLKNTPSALGGATIEQYLVGEFSI